MSGEHLASEPSPPLVSLDDAVLFTQPAVLEPAPPPPAAPAAALAAAALPPPQSAYGFLSSLWTVGSEALRVLAAAEEQLQLSLKRLERIETEKAKSLARLQELPQSFVGLLLSGANRETVTLIFSTVDFPDRGPALL